MIYTNMIQVPGVWEGRELTYFGTFLIFASRRMRFTPERMAKASVPAPVHQTEEKVERQSVSRTT